MDAVLEDANFDYISGADKAFVHAFDQEMTRLGYDCGGVVGPGYCWGKHMLIYRKTGLKSKNVAARIYLQESGVVLRLFLNQVDTHRAFIECAPPHIKEVFTGDFGACRYDRDDGGGKCMFRKSYTLDGRRIDKCNGLTFWFFQPANHPLGDYVALFEAFFPQKKAGKAGKPA
jgi:hypothetical protein